MVTIPATTATMAPAAASTSASAAASASTSTMPTMFSNSLDSCVGEEEAAEDQQNVLLFKVHDYEGERGLETMLLYCSHLPCLGNKDACLSVAKLPMAERQYAVEQRKLPCGRKLL